MEAHLGLALVVETTSALMKRNSNSMLPRGPDGQRAHNDKSSWAEGVIGLTTGINLTQRDQTGALRAHSYAHPHHKAGCKGTKKKEGKFNYCPPEKGPVS